MELIDLSLIKPMLIRSLENSEAIKNFINDVIFGGFIGIPICIITIIIILSIIFKTFRDVTKGGDNKEENKIKPGFWKSLFNNIKFYIKKYQDFFVGLLLLSLSRAAVSLIFRCISSWMNRGIDLHINNFSDEELRLLGTRSLYTLLFFVIAPIFIMFSFGNKFVRNIGIFIYILGIFFVPLGRFLQLGYSGANYSTEAAPYQYINYNHHEIPDSAEILVEHTNIIEGEAVNLSVTIKKDGKKMDNYKGTIFFAIVDEDGAMLKPSEYTLPNNGIYTFINNDGGYKEFQKGLTISKEGSFYIEVSDLNDFEDKVLGKQKIEVIKKP